ncbi:MAG TPA: DUF378 domain-containing protein [Candidatus Baltobacteraceae bacterium]|nr:DUF378 domain-containing protein [Candidatus Baltobacteraceae bacterium]
MKLCGLHMAAWVLVMVGALNWGLYGLARINLVNMLFGSWPLVERVVYILVGLGAVAMLVAGKCCMRGCKCDDGGCDHCGPMEGKKPMMGGDKPMTGGEHKM